MREHFQNREQQLENRLRKVETAAKSPQLHDVSKEIDRRVAQLERSESPQVSRETRNRPRPRSVVRVGVLVTPSDGLWGHLGTDAVDDMEDHLIDAMVQSPFCPVCLKRAVGRDRHKKSPKSWHTVDIVGFLGMAHKGLSLLCPSSTSSDESISNSIKTIGPGKRLIEKLTNVTDSFPTQIA